MRLVEENVVVREDGQVVVDDLPVKAGDRVRVQVLIPDEQTEDRALYPLRGKTPYKFENPTDPVMPEDWEARE